MIRTNEFFRPDLLDGITTIQGLALVALVAFFVWKLLTFLFPKKRSGHRWRNDRWSKKRRPALYPVDSPVAPLSDPKVQMEAVANSAFVKQRLLNREEFRLLPLLESIIEELDQGHRLTIQTSLGELIRAKAESEEIQNRAFASINSKRLDFGIVDRAGYLAVAIEYQGSGHYHATSFMRDAVKREALRKAGVQLLEIHKDLSPEKVKSEIVSRLSQR